MYFKEGIMIVDGASNNSRILSIPGDKTNSSISSSQHISTLDALKQRAPEVLTSNPFRTTAAGLQLPSINTEISRIFSLTQI